MPYLTKNATSVGPVIVLASVPIGYEIIARRIVEAARTGKRDLKRLTEAALVALPKNKRD
jgi:hypothetical protein